MIIRYSFKNRALKLYFHIEKELGDIYIMYSGKDDQKIKLIRPYCSFLLPSNFTEENIQPDCIALISLLIIYPFIGERVFYGFPVSSSILQSIKNLGIDCQTVEIEKPLIQTNKPLFPGIVYSGGVQSTAALLLLHKTAKLIYLDHIDPYSYVEPSMFKKGTVKNKDHIYYTLEHLIKKGYNVCIVRSDIKQMFSPCCVYHLS